MLVQLKDKIIVFSDNIFALRTYAVAMRKPMIYGNTSHQERTRILHKFKHSPDVSLHSASLLVPGKACPMLLSLRVLMVISPGCCPPCAQRLGPCTDSPG